MPCARSAIETPPAPCVAMTTLTSAPSRARRSSVPKHISSASSGCAPTATIGPSGDIFQRLLEHGHRDRLLEVAVGQRRHRPRRVLVLALVQVDPALGAPEGDLADAHARVDADRLD